MKKPNYLFLLILVLAALAGGLIIWRLFIYQPPSITPPAPSPSPTPAIPTLTVLPSPTTIPEGLGDSPANLLESLKTRFPLIESLPYKTDRFIVDYQAPLFLKVEIKIATQTAEIKKEVLDWIKSKGVDPETHQINWLIPAP